MAGFEARWNTWPVLLAIVAAVAYSAPLRAQVPAPTCAAGQGTFEGLPDLDPNRMLHPVAVSRDGRTIAGVARRSGDKDLAFRLRVSESGSSLQLMNSIPGFGNNDAFVVGVADNGTVLGYYGGGLFSGGFGFRWGALSVSGVALCGLPGMECGGADLIKSRSAAGISSDGTVISADYWFDTGIEVCSPFSGCTTQKSRAPFRWTAASGFMPVAVPSGAVAYAASPDGASLAGNFDRDEPVLWVDETPSFLSTLGAVCGTATSPIVCPAFPTDIANGGSVLAGISAKPGESTVDSGLPWSGTVPSVAVRWRNGAIEQLPHDGPSAQASAVADDGSLVVGFERTGATPTQAVVWDAKGQRHAAWDYLWGRGANGMDGWTLLTADDVRVGPLGGLWMVGTGRDPSGATRIWRATIPCLDDDLDGLCNTWERMGGIDLNEDGEISVCTPGNCPDLVLEDADPGRKDIYVEMDVVGDETPPVVPNEMVTQAFAEVPNSLIDNPNGMAGIKLHIEVDVDDWSDDIPLDDTVTRESGETFYFYADSVTADECDDRPDFRPARWTTTIRDRFGTPAERGSADVLEAKRALYRHVLYGGLDGCENGIAIAKGPHALVSTGLLRAKILEPDPSREPAWLDPALAGLLMHELGHTFGLEHGGEFSTNMKPNYHSVMNYAWTFPMDGSVATTGPSLARMAWGHSWVLDYSRTRANDLDEDPIADGGLGLDEARGIGGGHPWHLVPMGPPPVDFVWESGSVDFDRDGEIDTERVDGRDLNHVGYGEPSPGEYLFGFDDWSEVADFLCSIYGGDEWNDATAASALPPDLLDTLEQFTFIDCNRNGVIDDDDLANGLDTDDNANGILDGCEPLRGDVDQDGDIDEDDRLLLFASFGRTEGEPEYVPLADLDGDRTVTHVDYQQFVSNQEVWLAEQAAASASCGMLGIELGPLLALWMMRRRAHRSSSLPS